MACLLVVFCITAPYARPAAVCYRIHSGLWHGNGNHQFDYHSLDRFPVLGCALDMVAGTRQWVFLYCPDYRPFCADISGSVCAVWLVGRWTADRPLARHMLETGIASFPDHSHVCQSFAGQLTYTNAPRA